MTNKQLSYICTGRQCIKYNRFDTYTKILKNILTKLKSII